MNLYNVTNKSNRGIHVVAESEEQAREFARLSSHVRKAENAKTKLLDPKNMFYDSDGAVKVMESGSCGQLVQIFCVGREKSSWAIMNMGSNTILYKGKIHKLIGCLSDQIDDLIANK